MNTPNELAAAKAELAALTAERDRWKADYEYAMPNLKRRDTEIATIAAERDAERAAGARLAESHRQIREQLATCQAALEKAEIGLMNCCPMKGFDFETLPAIRAALAATKGDA